MPTYLLITRPHGQDPLAVRTRIETCCPGVKWLQQPAEIADDEVVDLFEATPQQVRDIEVLLRAADLDGSEVWPSPRWRSVREMIDDLEQRPETD